MKNMTMWNTLCLTGFTLAHIPLDTYSLIESAIVIGSIPITQVLSNGVPDAITPYLQEHDVTMN